MLEKHNVLPPEFRYVRRVEEVDIDEGQGRVVKVRFIVCMLAAMSWQFLQARVIEQDTSHKRVRNWLELTLGEWSNEFNRSESLAPAGFLGAHCRRHYPGACVLELAECLSALPCSGTYLGRHS